MNAVDIDHPFVARILGALTSLLWMSVPPEHRQLMLDRHKLMLADALLEHQRPEFEDAWDRCVAMQERVQEMGQQLADTPQFVDDVINSPRDALNAIYQKTKEI